MLRAVQTVIDEKLAQPILIGRPSVIEMRIKKFGLRMTPGVNLEIVDPGTTAASTKPGTPTTSSRAARA